ncbi:MAG: ribonuclease E/G, partial [Zetaproteobacteria bacterium]|nr:ribonuclease E/G [Pseudobdellovibrionaceae bacterium]
MLEKSLIVNRSFLETRIALLENSQLAKLWIERDDEKGILGNIYKGTVLRVLPGMNAAFVDIGLGKSAFLFGGDLLTPEERESQNLDLEESSAVSNKVEICPIQNKLADGQEVIVQVSKEPLGTKGPRVTTQPTIAGRYVVLMPGNKTVALSRRIEDEVEKRRLTNISEKLVENEDYGIIVRTAGQGAPKESIARDFNLL